MHKLFLRLSQRIHRLLQFAGALGDAPLKLLIHAMQREFDGLAAVNFLLEFIIAGFQRMSQPPQIQVRRHAHQHFFGLKRLGDVIHAARFKRFDFIENFIQRADENNGNVSRPLFRL